MTKRQRGIMHLLMKICTTTQKVHLPKILKGILKVHLPKILKYDQFSGYQITWQTGKESHLLKILVGCNQQTP